MNDESSDTAIKPVTKKEEDLDTKENVKPENGVF